MVSCTESRPLRRGDRVRLQVELTGFPIIDQEDPAAEGRTFDLP
jgi:hypothetical protein